ncbi:MAG TPA: ATP-binding protein [Thermoanaerobaculia bacterium]|nr:ATP-binding protein [Thermoanaerobaculia bacterium]
MPPSETVSSREWLRTTLDSLSDAIVVLDSAGRILLLNNSAESLLGIDRSLAAGRTAGDLLRLRDAETGLTIDLPPADDPLPTGASTVPLHAILLSTRSGSERPIDVSFEPLLDEGTASGTILVLRDAAPRLAAERALREKQEATQRKMDEELRRRAEEIAAADRRKDQFLAMLAHELRNPLAPIRNAVELMRQVETMDPSFQPSREMVERQVKNLARLVDDLLDVSRITQGSIRLRQEVVDLKTILERAVDATRSLIESRAHELTLDLPQEPIRLEADPTRLEQVVANLLNNAAKYTMPGGSIKLSGALEDKEAVIRVRDNGIGVPPDVLGRVFEPFVQSDGSLARTEGGLGIGLTLVRSLIEMHGGRVEANSPGLGQGSEFVVRLPVRVAQTAETTATDEPAPRPLARPVHVLVVEDNVDAAESLATLLRVWGHDVQVVHDGLDAIDAAREQRPEVVLLDIGLPGLDGYQVARRLREDVGLDSSLLVAMTGYGQPEDRRRSREAGIHHHFVKPVEPLVLRNLLADVAAPPGSGH